METKLKRKVLKEDSSTPCNSVRVNVRCWLGHGIPGNSMNITLGVSLRAFPKDPLVSLSGPGVEDALGVGRHHSPTARADSTDAERELGSYAKSWSLLLTPCWALLAPGLQGLFQLLAQLCSPDSTPFGLGPSHADGIPGCRACKGPALGFLSCCNQISPAEPPFIHLASLFIKLTHQAPRT